MTEISMKTGFTARITLTHPFCDDDVKLVRITAERPVSCDYVREKIRDAVNTAHDDRQYTMSHVLAILNATPGLTCVPVMPDIVFCDAE